MLQSDTCAAVAPLLTEALTEFLQHLPGVCWGGDPHVVGRHEANRQGCAGCDPPLGELSSQCEFPGADGALGIVRPAQ
jgi:hypothetical protein